MSKKSLALFFTRNVSLKLWVDGGLFEREKEIYEAHLEAGNLDSIYWVTYGCNDLELSELLKSQNRLHESINICQMPKIFNNPVLGGWMYSILIPLIHFKVLSKVNLLKTNQMDGSWSAVIAKRLFKKKLILRTGYTLSQLENKLKRQSLFKRKVIEIIEVMVYKNSDISVVSSEHNKGYIIQKYGLNSDKVAVIGNYININMFKPDFNTEKYKNKIVYIGRLSEEKNLINLIDAIDKTNLTLDVYGQGAMKERLVDHVVSKKSKVEFLGVVPNYELPKILNHYEYYILPSLFEGMPKTLLEAMACCLVCIGTNVSGINEVINNKVNGYLAINTDSQSIAVAINYALSSNNTKIKENARRLIEDKYCLKSYIEQECRIFNFINTSKEIS